MLANWRKCYNALLTYFESVLCESSHFQRGDVLNAAHATYTALLRNPKDDMMAKNLDFYLNKLNADEPEIVDLEQKRFVQFYLDALSAYQAKDYALVIEKMEHSLALFQHELDECRAFCEGDYAQGWQPDFVTSTASMCIPVKRVRSMFYKEVCINSVSQIISRTICAAN